MKNVLLEDVQYKTEETGLGRWRRFMYPNGQLFAEYRSTASLFGLPLVHYTHGRCPETGRRIVATGVLAIGRLACGVVAIGQACIGIVAVGQLAIGLILGLGQAATGVAALGQLAIGVSFALEERPDKGDFRSALEAVDNGENVEQVYPVPDAARARPRSDHTDNRPKDGT